jgi:predicted dehydrogenase
MNRREFVGAVAAGAGVALGANERIGIGIIGCGERGTALLREVLQFGAEENVEVRAVCDTWRPQRERAAAVVRAAATAEPRQFIHYSDLWELRDVDAVIIATPDHQHCAQLIGAAQAGKDAYVEKPLAMGMGELLDAMDAVRRRERVVQCGTQVRSFPSSAAARAFVAAGGLGRIFKIEQSRNSLRPYWHRYGERPIRESDVDWRAFLMHRQDRPFDPDQYTAWYGYREFSRGPHTGLMAHFVDLVHYITGAGLPRRVTALGGTYRWQDARTAPDSIEVTMEYAEGFLARYSTTFGTEANNFLKFFGTRGVIDATKWGEPWLLTGEEKQIPPVESVPHMKNWLQCLRTRRAPHAPMEAGYAHAVTCIMADEAYVRGRRMIFDPIRQFIFEG